MMIIEEGIQSYGMSAGPLPSQFAVQELCVVEVADTRFFEPLP